MSDIKQKPRIKKARKSLPGSREGDPGSSSSGVMGKPKDRDREDVPALLVPGVVPPKRHRRERWLMTRKTWRYMADAGRRLIPEGVRNRPEDVPKVEAYFQEVCKREPRFLLWRKSSYPGALGFRRKKHHRRKKGGSCRERMASSADEAEDIVAPSGTGPLVLKPEAGGRFDLQRLRREFLLGPQASGNDADKPAKRPDSLPLPGVTGVAFRPQRQQLSPTSAAEEEEASRREFIQLLKDVLKQPQSETGSPSWEPSEEEYEKLLEQLREFHPSPEEQNETDGKGFIPLQTVVEHVQTDGSAVRGQWRGGGLLPPQQGEEQLRYQLRKTEQSRNEGEQQQFRVNLRKVDAENDQRADGHGFEKTLRKSYGSHEDDSAANAVPFPTLRSRSTPDVIGRSTSELGGYGHHYSDSREGRSRSSAGSSQYSSNHQLLLDTLRRHYSTSTSRQKVISDLLTDRKLLAKLYFDLHKSRDFGGRKGYGNATGHSSPGFWKESASGAPDDYYKWHKRETGNKSEPGDESDSQDTTHWWRLGRSTKQRSRDPSPFSPPPLIEVQEDEDEAHATVGTQTPPISDALVATIEEHLRKKDEAAKEEKESEGVAKEPETAEKLSPPPRRRSSVDNDDVSPSVSDTIKRYLRMARKKSIDAEKQDRFKRVNYDRNLRNIKPKGEITKPGDDDGPNKGAQTERSWVDAMRELRVDDLSTVEESAVAGGGLSDGSRAASTRSSFDAGSGSGLLSPPSPGAAKPHGLLASGQTFLHNLLHGLQQSSSSGSAASAVAGGGGGGGGGSGGAAGPAAMQKSKSSSSVVHHGSRLVSRKIWRARSKSQSRSSASAACTWTPQGNCTWSNGAGRTVCLSDVSLLQLSEPERLVLAQVALAKLRALNLGVTVRVPSDTVAAPTHKPKRKAYLLKRKAITTSIFDTGRAKDATEKDKESSVGQVFGVPLSQCIESERLSKISGRGSRSHSGELRQQSRHGSRASFSSLIEASRPEEVNKMSGSCESLMVGSVPGLLDSLSCGSSADMLASPEEEPGIPNIVTACLSHLETYGLNTLGIFRVSTSKKRVRQLREEFDCGKEIALGREHSPHDVATLLKEYFRDLPEPLLCTDLYPAFIQTQRIRNRRLQYEALQHLVQLLPVANRDTLWALISFLANVARHAPDTQDSSGEWVVGNKMDSNNLATVFAPNILHCVKPGSSKDTPTTQERAEDRIDVINVLRTMIDHYKDLFTIQAELLDEVYVHMMDSHPEALEQLLNKRVAADEGVEDLETPTQESESTSTPRTPTADVLELHLEEPTEASEAPPNIIRRMWSREEFLHETAGMGGPDVAMRPRHKDRTRERPVKKRWREESSKHHQMSEADSRRSSDGSCASTEGGVITASLKIPVPGSLGLDESDIPFIEDSGYSVGIDGHQQMTIGVIQQTAPIPRRRRHHSASGSDSSQASVHPSASADSALGSSSVATTALSSPPRHATPPSMCSSSTSWASSPPTSPDATANVSFLAAQDSAVKSSSSSSVVYQRQQSDQPRGTMVTAKEVAPIVLQKVTFASTSELRQVQKSGEQLSSTYSKEVNSSSQRMSKDSSVPTPSSRLTEQLPKSASTTSVLGGGITTSKQAVIPDTKVSAQELAEQRLSGDRKYTTSISSIGGAVLRSKTADIERMLRIEKAESTRSPEVHIIPIQQVEQEEKKKYTKRRYTDSRHQTRHIPDAETLKDSSTSAPAVTAAQRRIQQGPVYKRRELIASETKQSETFL